MRPIIFQNFYMIGQIMFYFSIFFMLFHVIRQYNHLNYHILLLSKQMFSLFYNLIGENIEIKNNKIY